MKLISLARADTDYRWYKYSGKSLELSSKKAQVLKKNEVFGILVLEDKSVELVLQSRGLGHKYRPTQRLLFTIMENAKASDFDPDEVEDEVRIHELAKELDAAVLSYFAQLAHFPAVVPKLSAKLRTLTALARNVEKNRYILEFEPGAEEDVSGPSEKEYRQGVKLLQTALKALDKLPVPKGKPKGPFASDALGYALRQARKRSHSVRVEALQELVRYISIGTVINLLVSRNETKAKRMYRAMPLLKPLVSQELSDRLDAIL